MKHDNVRTIREFYRVFYNEKRFTEGAAVIAENFVNHHPGAHGVGPQGIIDDFTRLALPRFPNMHFEPVRIFEQGDFVCLIGKVTGVGEGKQAMCVDIWRLADGAIAEHWDVSRVLGDDENADAFFAALAGREG